MRPRSAGAGRLGGEGMFGRRALVTVLLLLVGVGVAAACGGDSASSGGASGELAEVEVLDNTFDPETLEIAAGTTVRWTNDGRSDHNIRPVADGAGFGVETADFEPGDTYEYTFESAGSFAYYCTIHGTSTSGQIGEVVVGGAESASGDEDADDETAGEPETIRVPEDFETIQAAVDATSPGDLVLVGPGVYEEAVTVETDEIVIRGLDRNEVIVDGGFELENGIRVVGADGVAVENLTARNFTKNGFFWTGVDGYRGSYLTAYRNGDYGVYAFDSVNGQFDNSYASGSPDAGFYIGQCDPCNAVIDNVVAEYNGLGYSGTNSGGDLYIVRSTFRYNHVGVSPNSGDYEEDPPERDTTIVGNLVHDNAQTDAPGIDIAIAVHGNGIIIGGGVDNLVQRNLVYGHPVAGITAVPLPDETLWLSTGNRFLDNVVSDSGVADLLLVAEFDDGNCFAGNTFLTSRPADIEALQPCDGEPSPFPDDREGSDRQPVPDGGDFEEQPVPPEQPDMPNAAEAPARPAVGGPPPVDLAAIPLPARPAE